MKLFGTKGQKFLHCPKTEGQRDRSSFIAPGQRDNKGTTKGQAKNLAKGRAGTAKIRDRFLLISLEEFLNLVEMEV